MIIRYIIFPLNIIGLGNKIFIFTMSIEDKSDKELRVILDKEIYEKLEKIREFHGLKNMTEVIRFLITKEFRNIEK